MRQSVNSVLLVDDDKATSFFNEIIVSRHKGFNQIEKAFSGQEALAYLKEIRDKQQIKPDLILLDINMPAMNGWEFITEFEKLDKSFTNSIKVVLLSTSSCKDDLEKSLTSPTVLDFIHKPLSFDALDILIDTHFNEYTKINA
ncbi:response regulator [Aquimarina brevivitae]|uniref:Response regulator receiver domain-containing protein n=1 Tax=Aquimarina brevivitae TaxID=323412 RepID=A0A4Q7NZF5_9FLAO|nr:response regulator [Aquimarina brevivitae]RZS92440.1 response regulator receiver domain-containing protein [Aquimarina brevivitae]